MTSEKLVFVLGAGASSHFGYPLGNELIEAMEKFLDGITAGKRSDEIDESLTQRISRASSFITRVQQFNPLNIDYYLHNNQQDLEIARKLIEATLTHIQDYNRFQEHRDLIKPWSPHSPNGYVTEKSKMVSPNIIPYIYQARNWVKFLHHKLVANAKKGTEVDNVKAALDNIKVITFNYDISFEQALFRYFQKSELFSEILGYLVSTDGYFSNNVHHVYGKIAHDNYECPSATGDRIGIFSKALGTGLNPISPSKALEKNPEDEIAIGMLREANKIYFLGYGFDEFNNNKIGLYNVLQESTQLKNLYYTNMCDALIPDSVIRSFFEGRHFESFGADNRIKQVYKKFGNGIHPDTRIDIIKSTKNVYEALEKDLFIPILEKVS